MISRILEELFVALGVAVALAFPAFGVYIGCFNSGGCK